MQVEEKDDKGVLPAAELSDLAVPCPGYVMDG